MIALFLFISFGSTYYYGMKSSLGTWFFLLVIMLGGRFIYDYSQWRLEWGGVITRKWIERSSRRHRSSSTPRRSKTYYIELHNSGQPKKPKSLNLVDWEKLLEGDKVLKAANSYDIQILERGVKLFWWTENLFVNNNGEGSSSPLTTGWTDWPLGG